MQPNPNPFNPPHQPPEIDLPAERSVAPKVLGILNLMFAVMGILGAVVGLLMVWGIQAVESSPNNPAVEMMQNPGYKRRFSSPFLWACWPPLASPRQASGCCATNAGDVWRLSYTSASP